MSNLSLFDLSNIAKKKNLEFKNQNKIRLKELNPELHLKKLLESHNFTNQDNDFCNFFSSIMNDDFFNDNLMPSRWNHKTWSESMRSLIHLFNIDNVKSYLISNIGIDKYNETIIYCDNMRKKWMKSYRNEKNKDIKTKNIEDECSISSVQSQSECLSLKECEEHVSSVVHGQGGFILHSTHHKNIIKKHIMRIIEAKKDDQLLVVSLLNILDIISLDI